MNTIKIDSKQAKMIAHRGLSGLERENTCPAFVAAGNRSYFGIETDVHITKDGKFVIIHDETTDRVSLGQSSINVEENDYAAVSGLVLPDLDQTTNRQDIRIPLLADYINICKKYDKVCVLELKNAFPEECIKKIIQEIQSLGYIENIIFISFHFGNFVFKFSHTSFNNLFFTFLSLILHILVKDLHNTYLAYVYSISSL